ncbi:MAG: amidase [Betaproteobacteria bacterium]|jgi:Asp-tRNA(Asn)/Glu-tRNA(Gln) amidotransferase A subunit family amidase|nr:MAG: amidase [Betaproteobacteria bacterium]
MTELYRIGLHDAAKRIRSGKLKPSTYLQSLLARIDSLEHAVKAWQWLDRERAMELARTADSAATPWKAAHPLHGVPIGVKDNFYTAGIPTEMGCRLYAGYVPDETADVVVRVERAGAFMLGKTVTTEAAFMVPAKTTNPWNARYTPGGSSSGSAAAVAAGFVPAAIGTQTNGSVVRPAAFCGVVGYKPSQGMLSARGIMPFSPSLDQPGVFARSVADVALLAWSLTARRSSISPEAPTLKGAPRLAAVRSPVWHLAQPEQRAQFEADVARLREAGALIDIIEIPGEFDRAHKVHRTIMLFEAARVSRKVRAHYRESFSDYLNDALDQGEVIADADYRDALKLRTQLQHSLAAFLDRGYSAIITPPAAGEAPASLDVTGDPSFCSIWTLMGTPAITIPTGKGPNGMPLGLQLVGAVEEENYLLSTAAWCERHSPFKGLI